MPTWSNVTHAAVRKAIEEYDRVGQEEFLSEHGFGRATSYLLKVDGVSYDSKAVLGVAYLTATGERIDDEHFGGRDGAAKVLRDLGFEVVEEGGTGPASSRPKGTYRVIDLEPVPAEAAKASWAEQARVHLLQVAQVYQELITYKELADEVQQHTGIRTSLLMRNWMGDVLTLVAQDCGRRKEPILSALCVTAEGLVGDGYAAAIRTVRGESPADSDQHAAVERLACYRHFGADLPADGGRPALTPKVEARRNRAMAQRPEVRGRPCPTCFVEVPVSGSCATCDS
jgi:hypothetical protein